MFARVILSWFPLQPGTALFSIAAVVRDLTEPVLAPLRRGHPAGRDARPLGHGPDVRAVHPPRRPGVLRCPIAPFRAIPPAGTPRTPDVPPRWTAASLPCRPWT
ncbi:MAG: YggT family protein [Acidimicrobiia bacterium]|nr:YggT family protein [Acidimicrobiia bacterium]